MQKEFEVGQIVWGITTNNSLRECEAIGGVFVTSAMGFAICSPVENGVFDVCTLLENHARRTANRDDTLLRVYRMADCYGSRQEALEALENERRNKE